jgi:large exoprotein involved in heme utilization and adhesion
VLNRVVTQNPSTILGALQSNGRVFIVNPNGILFGAGAQVNVAGLVASSLSLSDADFLAGRMRFADGRGAGVVNQGNISAGAGGNVYLIGSAVTNNGIITSPQGEVILTAGNSVELVNPGTPNLRVEIAAADNQAINLGQILSDAGRVGIFAGLINNAGSIRADSAVSEGGRILLKATKSVTLENSSVLTAQGQGGGEIKVLAGDNVQVAGRLDSSRLPRKKSRLVPVPSSRLLH